MVREYGEDSLSLKHDVWGWRRWRQRLFHAAVLLLSSQAKLGSACGPYPLCGGVTHVTGARCWTQEGQRHRAAIMLDLDHTGQLLGPSQTCQSPSWSSWTDSKVALGLTNSHVFLAGSLEWPPEDDYESFFLFFFFSPKRLFWLNGLPCHTQCSYVVAFVRRIIARDLCLHAHTTVSSAAFSNDNTNCSEKQLEKNPKQQNPKTHRRNRESILYF